ncbi:MAG: oligosaccharide repeat unit polymerase [Hungatella sp.]|nr:oligosaccharide repeat unit polymerase [Hungatella sp.]
MGGYIAAAFLAIAIIRILKDKTLIAPDVIFTIEWFLICGLASLQLYEFYEVGSKTWLMVLIGGLSYCVGVRLSASKIGLNVKSGEHISHNKRTREIKNDSLKYIFWILGIIILTVRVYNLYRTRIYIEMGYTLAEIRAASYGAFDIPGFRRSSTGIMVLVRKIFDALNTIVIAEGVYLSIFSAKKDYRPIMVSFLITIMSSLSDGGRFGLVYLFIEIIVCIFLERKKERLAVSNYKKRKKRSWMFYILIGVLLIGMVFGVTAMRGRTGDVAIEHLYLYLCGDAILLDRHIGFLESSDMSYGFSGLYGITTIVLPILKHMGIPYPKKYLDVGAIIEQAAIPKKIGTHSVMNAFVTPYYYLYADFRWVGIIIGMILFGIVSGNYYNRAVNDKNHFNIIIYLIISQMIFKTVHQYYLSSSDYVIILFIALIVRKFRFTLHKSGFETRQMDY